MTTFNKLPRNQNIHELIKATFDVDLAIEGGWGYSKEAATSIKALPEEMTLAQLEHMLASIRAHLEMNITQEQEQRYSGINANEKSRKEYSNQKDILHEVTYEITAMKESLYTAFIKEYKEGYGKEEFDLMDHFKRRKEATLSHTVIHYFEVSGGLVSSK